MNSLLKRFETAMVAAAFAEEGEFESARQIMKEGESGDTEKPVLYKCHKISSGKELRAGCNGA